jgi:hypothetical protein
MVKKFVEIAEEQGWEILGVEKLIKDSYRDYGFVDFVIRIEGDVFLADIKTNVFDIGEDIREMEKYRVHFDWRIDWKRARNCIIVYPSSKKEEVEKFKKLFEHAKIGVYFLDGF